MSNSQCQYINSEGYRCKGYAIKDSDFCFFHDPNSQQARDDAARKGGKAKKAVNIGKVKLRNLRDYIRLTEETLAKLQNGTYTPAQANAINRLLNTFREGYLG